MVVTTGKKESYKRVGPLTPITCVAKFLHPTIQDVTDTEEARIIQLREFGHTPMVCLYVANNFMRSTDYRRESINNLDEVRYDAKALCWMCQYPQ